MQQRTLLIRRVLIRRVLETAFEKVLTEGFLEGVLQWVLMGRRVLLRRVLRRGSKKGLSRRHLEGRSMPFRECDPVGVCPSQNGAFGKRSFCWGATRHFRHFRRFPGSEEQNPLFLWAECNIRIFANFRQNHLFSAGGKTTVFQNDRFDNPDYRGPEGHHRRGTTLREALRGNLPLREFSGASAGVCSRVLQRLRGAMRGSVGVRGIFRG